MLGYHCDLDTQQALLHTILRQNEVLYEVLKGARDLGLSSYYVGAGCICQSVWNHQNGLPPMYGISDLDLVYFDEDTSYKTEDAVIHKVQAAFSRLPVEIDVKNQARVHLWYKQRFGYEMAPYTSVEAAISSWPTTATAVGVRLEGERLVVYAPFGLDDLFGQIVRANKTQITEETYQAKCGKWSAKWDSLRIIPW